ncbi:hypothetical protein [Paenibacillus tepidiphilus]|uniref:hypothetical protein n=1 Tax=Paenibacillus tepidiphilus TaxID=2608683 RepID=UPI0012384EAB|nr:hypothetical protein [Paenibacillus tepidiphilus]
MVLVNKLRKSITPYLLVTALMLSFFSIMTFIAPLQADAATPAPASPNFKSSTQIGDGTSDISTITDTLKQWILFLRIIGAVVAVVGLVLGAILFSISMGSPQKRALATASMVGAVIGIVIIAKAPVIADYFIGQSAV